MEKKVIGYSVALIILLVVIVGGLWYAQKDEEPNRQMYTALAECLKENGAVFYGAFWCPACAQQKSFFKSAVKKLPYAECSTSDRTGQTKVCEEKGIKSYPTWEFAGGKRACGIVTPEVLAYLADCPIPVSDETESVQEMYKRLIQKPMMDNLTARGNTLEEREQKIKEAGEVINALMLLRHNVSLEEAQDSMPLLSAIYEVAYRCVQETESQETIAEEGEESEVVSENTKQQEMIDAIKTAERKVGSDGE